MSNKSKIQEVRTALNKSFFEREGVVDGMLVALLSRQMLFLLGPPGTGKSAICEAICQSIDGSYFQWLVSKFTTPEELFGPYSMKSLESEQFLRVTKGKLPEASIAFVDEIFKGSSAILNTLLPIINERTFYNGTTPTKIPLQVLFGASNEIPQAQELRPLWDRFALRYVVKEMRKSESFKSLIKDGLNVSIPKISLAELADEQQAASKVGMSDAVIDLIHNLREDVRNSGLLVSDRKWVQIISIVKAYAHLDGSKDVKPEHLDILSNVLWDDPKQFNLVRKLVAKHAFPMGEMIQEFLDAGMEAEQLLNDLKVPTTKSERTAVQPKALEIHGKVKEALERLKKMGNPEENRILKEAIERLDKLTYRIVKDFIGL